ncbi:MAG: 2-C-methyl-D-erythritol 4-phosphate cytidylyltransferase [Thermoanaerobacterales bacterium]|jgi:2-C-methyl-D-erythritol 4-phosphate cytidylyltransferase|nr:2-C-methyl-D-erythritol 4-phosphate cytidylyltransferase [Thermoanaerobacterales bacterium]
MQVSAVIAAGGRGKRMNIGFSKQFLNIKGRPILYYTLSTFESFNMFKEIILVVGQADFTHAQNILKNYKFMKTRLVNGGNERQDSVYNGLRALSTQTDIVVIHDGVRPFVKRDLIKRTIDAACEYKAAGAAVPVKDTIKIVENEKIKHTPDRKTLWAMQTPQTFDYQLILNAYETAFKNGYYGTDDAVLVERIGLPVKIIEGAYENIKITTPEDIVVAEVFVTMGYGDFRR